MKKLLQTVNKSKVLGKGILFLSLLIICCLLGSFTSRPAAAPEMVRVAPIQQPGALVYNWPSMSAGDCVMATITLTLNPDGSGSVSGTAWTNHTHSGDTWHFGFATVDVNGNVVLPPLNFDGPNHMNDDGSRYPFVRYFNFNPALLPLIASVALSGNC